MWGSQGLPVGQSGAGTSWQVSCLTAAGGREQEVLMNVGGRSGDYWPVRGQGPGYTGGQQPTSGSLVGVSPCGLVILPRNLNPAQLNSHRTNINVLAQQTFNRSL